MKSEALKRNAEKENLNKIQKKKIQVNGMKLATGADFVAKGAEDLLAKSVGLRACISKATKHLPYTDNEKVSDIAVLCIVQLEY
jgi:hypothetical protein